MTRFFLAVLLLTNAALFSACQKKEATVVTPPRPHSTVPKPFMPPEDGIVTPSAAQAYASARSEMVQVNAHLLDSLGMASSDRKAVFTQALDLACEKVARRHGLHGAAEYRWIQEHAAALPQNREALGNAGVIIP